ncbi:hypothetical protein [Riemerella anatipestifer]|uniref:hypothetical protein n=1 Tax=Riemerella anatipestifer TaxID=34085 RepID=UPI0021F8AEAB|nr:hypothetical protein [Riemerella anatipestifer]MCW0517531.1 hypothetical protein [Riemerella anatipestifer]
MPTLSTHTHWQVAQSRPASQNLPKSMYAPTHGRKKARLPNITYTQAGVSCFVGQESGKFEVQFFVGSSVVKIPACV